jgi:hypothetical protein
MYNDCIISVQCFDVVAWLPVFTVECAYSKWPIPCMPLAPHVIDTKKYTYMPLSGTQGMSIKSDGIPGIFSTVKGRQ